MDREDVAISVFAGCLANVAGGGLDNLIRMLRAMCQEHQHELGGAVIETCSASGLPYWGVLAVLSAATDRVVAEKGAPVREKSELS